MTRRDWFVPLILVIVSSFVLLVGSVFILINDARWGTVSEWIGALGTIFAGVLAAVFAGLAWHEAKGVTAATHRAVVAEERSNLLMEQQLASGVAFSLKATDHFENAYVLQLKASEGSPVVWLRGGGVKMIGGNTPAGSPSDQITLWASQLEEACSMFRGIHLASGGTTEIFWIHGDVDPADADPFLASVAVTYSVTSGKDATEFDSPPIRLAMPDKPFIR